MRVIRAFVDEENDRILFAENCKNAGSTFLCEECGFFDKKDEEQYKGVCKICDREFAVGEKLINVIYGNLAKAVLGFMEGKEDVVREGISEIKEKTNPRDRSEIISEQIEDIVFSSGMKYAPAATLALLGLRDTDDIEMINECIRLLERHKMYLKSLHPMKKEVD